ncbi:MAG: acyl-CoA carboxylase subunit beta [Flavobacteriales bacterium]|nr:acyl-CoA carboxylase subunit beta [Flavobacteriales bacterium]
MPIPQEEIERQQRVDAMKLKLSEMDHQLQTVKLGGGQARIDKEHKKGKLTARERLALLMDEGEPLLEVGAFSGHGMYQEHGGCPGGGCVVVMGKVSGVRCIAVANDATVKAGAWFPITGKKHLRAQELAFEFHLPIIYLVDSAGVYLPMQDEIFPDKEHFGRIFRNNARLSAVGIPQLAAVMGSCVAGGAYLPIMSDESIIVKGTGSIFLAGPYLVRAAIGEDVDAETLGGADMHGSISGVVDHVVEDDRSALALLRNLMAHRAGRPSLRHFARNTPKPPLGDGDELLSVLPASRREAYDVRSLLSALVDGGEFTEFKRDYGKTILCATARIDGWSVGIVANQRMLVKSAKQGTQFGGVIYSDSADKAARFVMNCNQKGVPLVFLQDVTGFMVGSKSEQGGIIKDGAKLVNAMANSVVPKFTVVVGNSYGAGNYAMCGKAYDPKFMVAWPTAELAVMGGAQAAGVLLQIEVASRKKQGEEITQEREAELRAEIESRYAEQVSPYYAAARLWVDAIIDPRETRSWISEGIALADGAPPEGPYRTGVLQT